jgi:electron transport complex protein RnfG
MDFKEIIKIALNLMVIFLVGGLLIGGLYSVTSPIIFQKNKEEKEQALSRMLKVHLKMKAEDTAALKEAMPEGATVFEENAGVLDIVIEGSEINRKLLKRFKKAGAVEIEEYSDNMPVKIGDWEPWHKHAEFFKVEEDGELQAYIVQTFGKGYSSYINILTAVSTDLVVQKIKVLSHGETPGLGDEILVDWFTKQYEGKDREHLVVIKGETEDKIQAITGATISTRAVTDGVRDAVDMLEKYESGEFVPHEAGEGGGGH